MNETSWNASSILSVEANAPLQEDNIDSSIWNVGYNNATTILDSDFSIPTVLALAQAPTWMVDFVAFRKRLFLRVVEPVIVGILGPVTEKHDMHSTMPFALSDNNNLWNFNNSGSEDYWNYSSSVNHSVFHVQEATMQHRRLGSSSFLPDYVEDASLLRETSMSSSMSFATLITLFVTMASILLIFLSCFYHNQKCVVAETIFQSACAGSRQTYQLSLVLYPLIGPVRCSFRQDDTVSQNLSLRLCPLMDILIG